MKQMHRIDRPECWLVSLACLILLVSGCAKAPDSPEILLERARILMDRGQGAEAIPFLDSAVDSACRRIRTRIFNEVLRTKISISRKGSGRLRRLPETGQSADRCAEQQGRSTCQTQTLRRSHCRLLRTCRSGSGRFPGLSQSRTLPIRYAGRLLVPCRTMTPP